MAHVKESLNDEQAMTLLRLYASLWTTNLAEHGWHISGAGTAFYGHHELFERMYDDTSEHIDTLGERMQLLGQAPAFHVDHLSDLSQIEEALPEARDRSSVSLGTAIDEAYEVKEALIREAQRVISMFGEDATTEDIAIEIARGQEEHLYLIQQIRDED